MLGGMLVDIQFSSAHNDWGRVRDAVLQAEDEGYDTTWVFDHFDGTVLGGDRPLLECFTLMGAMAAATTRIGIGALVVNVANRHPAARRVVVVGEREVAGPQPVQHAQHGQRRADRVPALHADERGNAASGACGLHLVGRASEHEVVGLAVDHAVDEVDLLQRGKHRLGLGQGRRHVRRPELSGDPTRVQARDVGVHLGKPGQ
ncbi:MAG TPA: hypothetical protein DCR14_05080 [Acidimicrobiaceae bacterium]|nr:hypothetical protein [Acidimicrobiaceae bacterium]